ncbi:MAG: M48 family metalloprotease [Terriglobales bacterium]|jgi:hypothetical protein
MIANNKQLPVMLLVAFVAWCAVDTPAQAAEAPPGKSSLSSAFRNSTESADEVMSKAVKREHVFISRMRQLHPLAETYIQNLRNDKELGEVPVSDQYFLGRLDLTQEIQDKSLLKRPGFVQRFTNNLSLLFRLEFVPLGFAQTIVPDMDFGQQYYTFDLVQREFLGDIRCFVIDVQPKPGSAEGRFLGRIWVEDQDYNIVRFNGTYKSRKHNYFHFDSWRMNVQPGMWLPTYIYSEETNVKGLHFKAETHLWSYNARRDGQNGEYSQILVDTQSVHDESETARGATPVESERLWIKEAEDNAINGMQRLGLIAPASPADKVLQTVINNLVITNNLNVSPDLRARVLLTTPLESFTIGNTILISRGLLDVLPDEASLAMVLAHELGHIVAGVHIDTQFAFNDRMLFREEDTFKRLDFRRDAADEQAADAKALQLLANSPYKDKLSGAGLFLEALQARAPELKNLIRPHLGNAMANASQVRMSALLSSAPKLEVGNVDQIAALPLNGRIVVDPWSDSVELAKAPTIALKSASEKMPFEVTPLFPHLTRFVQEGSVNAESSQAGSAD